MSLPYLHGIDVIEINDDYRPIRTAKSSVIGLVGTAGKGPVNQPVSIIGSRRAAVETFGKYRGDGFSIPQALDIILRRKGATVVVVNVCDPDTHTTAVSNQEVTFATNGTARLPHSFISTITTGTTITAPWVALVDATAPVMPAGTSAVTVKSGAATVSTEDIVAGEGYTVSYTATLVEGVDYSLNTETGEIVRASNGSKILPLATVLFSYSHVDPTKVVSADVVGATDGSGEYTGSQVLLAASSKVKLQPRILLAPHFTGDKPSPTSRNPVVAELENLANRMGGCYIADCPDTSYTEAILHRGDFGPLGLFHYPNYNFQHPEPNGSSDTIMVPSSVVIAALMNAVDNEEGFHVSPSNHPVNGVLSLTKPVDFHLNDSNTVANLLNENFVCTTIHVDGFRLWGNRFANGEFINRRRTALMVNESVLHAHLWAVDKNIGRGYVESVVEGVTEYLRRLTKQGVILGGKAWADREMNTDDVLYGGELYIDYEFTGPTPAETIRFRAHLVNTYVASIFDN